VVTDEECWAWQKTIEDEPEEEAVGRLRPFQLPRTPGFFEAPSGNRLHARVLPPAGGAAGKPAKAVILYVHGMNSHVNLKHWVDYLVRVASQGYVVAAVDIMGHGYSEGERALLDDWHDVFEDLEGFMEAFMGVANPMPGPDEFNPGIPGDVLLQARSLPIFMHGNSMGGMIGMYVGLRLQANRRLNDKFRGAILGYPALAVELPPFAVQAFLRHVVVPMFRRREMPAVVARSSHFPTCRAYNLNVPEQKIVAATEVRDSWNRLPEHGLSWSASMRWGTAGAFSKIFVTLEEDMKTVAYPFLLMHDPGDTVCLIKGSNKLMELSPSKDKVLKEIDGGGFHDVSLNRQEWFVATLDSWIRERL